MIYTLAHPRSMFIELNESTYDGFTESGIHILKKDFVVCGTWKNTARVLSTSGDCREVKTNDLVIFRKHAPKRLGAVEGEMLVLFEYQILGILRKSDGKVFFN